MQQDKTNKEKEEAVLSFTEIIGIICEAVRVFQDMLINKSTSPETTLANRKE